MFLQACGEEPLYVLFVDNGVSEVTGAVKRRGSTRMGIRLVAVGRGLGDTFFVRL